MPLQVLHKDSYRSNKELLNNSLTMLELYVFRISLFWSLSNDGRTIEFEMELPMSGRFKSIYIYNMYPLKKNITLHLELVFIRERGVVVGDGVVRMDIYGCEEMSNTYIYIHEKTYIHAYISHIKRTLE